MSKSTLLIAYEINGAKAKDLIVKGEGIVGKFKKFQNKKLVEHVSNSWQTLETIFSSEGHSFEHKLLYTSKDTNSLLVGSKSSDLINNSYLMSLLNNENVSDQRYFSFQNESEFEKQQFSLILDQTGSSLHEQEIGIFGWLKCSDDQVDNLLKKVAATFSISHGGELHFFEFTNSGRIYPNFSDVASQRFEGKLAGNYQMFLETSEHQDGIKAINDITLAVFRTEIFQIYMLPDPKQQDNEITTAKISKKTYTDDFKEKVATDAMLDGMTLAAVGKKYNIHPTLVRTWKINLEEQKSNEIIDNEIDSETLTDKNQFLDTQKIIEAVNDFKLEGHIDNDLELSVRFIFDEKEELSSELIVINGIATITSNEESIQVETFENFIFDGYGGPTLGYLKLEENCNPEFSIELTADLFRLKNQQIIAIDTSNKSALKNINLNKLPNFEINNFAITFDEVKDIEIKGSIALTGSNIYALAFETDKPEGECFHYPQLAEGFEAELDEGMYDIKEGATIYLIAAEFEKISDKLTLSRSGVAEISEQIEDDDVDYIDSDETDHQQFIYVAYINLAEIIAEFDVDGFVKTKNKISKKILSFMEGISNIVDGDSQFFLHDENDNIHSIQEKEDLKPHLIKEKSPTFQNIINKYDQLKLSFTAHGANHWDDGFLAASAMGNQDFNIWGFYPAIDDYAVQGYWNGDFDTGIAADPDSGDFYASEDKKSFYGIKDDDFESSKYGLNFDNNSFDNEEDEIGFYNKNINLDFSNLGDEPYNWYFNMLNKFEDYDLAEEKFTECLDGYLITCGIFDITWKELDSSHIKKILEHLETIEKYKDTTYNEKVNGPLHSFVHNALTDSGDNIESENESESDVTDGGDETISKMVQNSALDKNIKLSFVELINRVENNNIKNWDSWDFKVIKNKQQITIYLDLIPLFYRLKKWTDLKELLLQDTDKKSLITFRRDSAIWAKDNDYSSSIEYLTESFPDFTSAKVYLLEYIFSNVGDFINMIEEV
ncbi:transposase [bacterium]|nr:transposase [bacterium]